DATLRRVKAGERATEAPGAKRLQEEASSGHSVGQYLANQRRLRRISLEELAERTRIPRRNLERLESGAFDSAVDGFTRGFVRTVAEALGLDADEAVMRLVGEPPAEEDRALGAPRRLDPHGRAGADRAGGRSRRHAAGAALEPRGAAARGAARVPARRGAPSCRGREAAARAADEAGRTALGDAGARIGSADPA